MSSSGGGSFSSKGVDPSGIWITRTPEEIAQDKGACQGDSASDPALLAKIFSFDGRGGIRADLSAVDANQSTKGCMSYGAMDCKMPKDSIKAIQFTASTSGCFPGSGLSGSVWTAPLWMTPAKWIPPQGHSGEIDFMERCGTSVEPGFASNFGRSEDAGAGQTNFTIPLCYPNLAEPHTFYFSFDKQADSVTSYVCNATSDPIHTGVGADCRLIGVNKGYYARTQQSNPDANVFHFVSDIWNTPAASAGACTPDSGSLANRTCKYEVRGIKVAAQSGSQMFQGVCAALNA